MRIVLSNVLLAVILLFGSCDHDDQIVPEKIDFDQSAIMIMDSIRTKLYGRWELKEVHVAPKWSSLQEIGIKGDTLIKDLAVIEINHVDDQGYYRKNNNVSGIIRFRNKIYPVGFKMLATPNRIVDKTGPQVFMLLEFRFPVGTRTVEPEESYLYSLNLINENYTLEISQDGKNMIWEGLNRSIKEVKLVNR